jgi:hypothetical protein
MPTTASIVIQAICGTAHPRTWPKSATLDSIHNITQLSTEEIDAAILSLIINGTLVWESDPLMEKGRLIMKGPAKSAVLES